MAHIDDFLAKLRLESTVFCRMILAGEWGFAKEALLGAPFHIILSGEASVDVSGRSIALAAGDVVVLPSGEPHRLLARPGADAVPWSRVADEMGLVPWQPGARFKMLELTFGVDGPKTSLISGVFAFDDQRRNPLLAALPPVMHLRSAVASTSTAASLVSLLQVELKPDTPGSVEVSSRIADLLLLQVVRHYLGSADLPSGWLRGVADPQIAPALVLMQNAPQKRWSVAMLATAVGMSRSLFAARFKDVVGQSPLEFLTEWRMYSATLQLVDARLPVKSIADAVGYASDSSFKKAFKRWSGRSPAAYRRQHGACDRSFVA
ncbi:AraC family transcriptional regulator [Aurantimonas sp. 22II-16-19i]|uniref:AraC family transcriptional regulator n=1 Tax=Aurantimonas sp. 22II-16-19i TaxID=1317114 RepID=UPI0009F7B1FE|nr:AraC family transcriptional regulator [Aurantimonas sp. 22II-16-19i]ORE97508.1 AraC family transcriptional regulator [Aurantimonas sp. 22II-16-19i]